MQKTGKQSARTSDRERAPTGKGCSEGESVGASLRVSRRQLSLRALGWDRVALAIRGREHEKRAERGRPVGGRSPLHPVYL